MDLGFAGATAVVTGGSKGMGRAGAARSATPTGARVAVTARGREALDDTVAALQFDGQSRGGRHQRRHARAACCSSPLGLREVGDRLGLTQHPGPHHRTRGGPLRGPHGRRLGRGVPLGPCPPSAASAGRAAVAAAEWARVAIFSAHSVQRQSPILVAYTASKAAVTSVAKNLSKSLAPTGSSSMVCPGSIVTASFTENLRDIFAAEGLDPVRTRTTSCGGLSRHSISPPTSGEPASPMRSRPSQRIWCPVATWTSPAPASTSMEGLICSDHRHVWMARWSRRDPPTSLGLLRAFCPWSYRKPADVHEGEDAESGQEQERALAADGVHQRQEVWAPPSRRRTS